MIPISYQQGHLADVMNQLNQKFPRAKNYQLSARHHLRHHVTNIHPSTT